MQPHPYVYGLYSKELFRMCMTKSTVVCHLHLRNKISRPSGRPLTSGTGTSARLTANNRWARTIWEMQLWESWRAVTVELQCANTQEVRFNNSSSFLKSALISLYSIRILLTGELFWPPAGPQFVPGPPPMEENISKLGQRGIQTLPHKGKRYAKS